MANQAAGMYLYLLDRLHDDRVSRSIYVPRSFFMADEDYEAPTAVEPFPTYGKIFTRTRDVPELSEKCEGNESHRREGTGREVGTIAFIALDSPRETYGAHVEHSPW
jgi:hypothetical protein